jgi:hypothetical protein
MRIQLFTLCCIKFNLFLRFAIYIAILATNKTTCSNECSFITTYLTYDYILKYNLLHQI